MLSKINKKLDNLVDLIADGATNRESLVKRLDEYENQKNQIENNISQIGFKINELSSKLISHDAVMANLKFFNEVFGQLPGNKKKELLRLLIKKIIIEGFDGKVNGNGNKKKGKIKMSLWDLPPIDSSNLDSAGFAESKLWLPDRTTQRTNSSKTVAEIIPCFYRYYNKMKILCKGEKREFLQEEKIPTQREWRKYLNQGQKINPILEGLKYLEYLERNSDSTYKDVAK